MVSFCAGFLFLTQLVVILSNNLKFCCLTCLYLKSKAKKFLELNYSGVGIEIGANSTKQGKFLKHCFYFRVLLYSFLTVPPFLLFIRVLLMCIIVYGKFLSKSVTTGDNSYTLF